MVQHSHLPTASPDWAWFLDLDGTLIEIAERPGDVTVPEPLPVILDRLRRACNGALAVISGRPISQIHALLAPLAPCAAGLHGMERLKADGTFIHAPRPGASSQAIKAALQGYADGIDGLMVEDKGVALALHYRQAPEREQEARQIVRGIMQSHPDHRLLDGKMVFEIKPMGFDKGGAITHFMGEKPFIGRIPFYAGDDVTDEDGFRAVNALGGISVKIGADDRDSEAHYRVASVADFLNFLADSALGL